MEEISHRASQKILVLAIVVSLAGHLVMLVITGLMTPHAANEPVPFLSVELRDSAEIAEAHPQDSGQGESGSVSGGGKEGTGDRQRTEDTVDLGDQDSPYIPYLKKLKKKIAALWGYPGQAYERREEGDVVVRFSVNRSGGLEKSLVLTSSGSAFLDLGALVVIDAAAPYDPFPQEMNLLRLHIIATFKYRMDP
jgi:TonB family protein